MKVSNIEILFVFLLFLNPVFGQTTDSTFSINAVLIDSLNNEPVPYASIYKVRDNKGTLSNHKGRFVLENILQDDSIVCSYIGYEKLIFAAKVDEKYDTVYIFSKAQLMEEVIILADDAVLYQLVSNARKSNSATKRVAKTYFEMETFHNESQLELFQGYYNGTFKGYDISNLQMKSARFALAPILNRFFVSTETSKTMYMESLMNSDPYFPIGPTELNARQLRKYYTLSLTTKFKNQDERTIYAIKFEPKKNKRKHFKGTVWIDSLSNNIIKIDLKINDAERYPFQSLWSIHSLKKVNLELSKSFIELEGEMFLKSMDFNYDLTYQKERDSNFNISTRAILYAYNFEEEFILPYFNFEEVSNADYRKIQMLPDNKLFWDCNDDFKVKNNSEDRDYFLNKLAKIKNKEFFSTDSIFQKYFFEHPYVTWNGSRFLLREIHNDSTELDFNKTTILANQYHLEVQFFLDINELCDSLQIITQTVFDPFKTFYKFPMTKEGQAFINIYFDLMEIERRKMQKELLKCGNDLLLIETKYNEAKNQAYRMSEKYFKEMQRGTNRENLLKWNAIVLKELNIDNVSIFGIEK